jgi:outer membrane protein assembly factor BamE (lipoprotein component of BamABCDE complex)
MVSFRRSLDATAIAVAVTWGAEMVPKFFALTLCVLVVAVICSCATPGSSLSKPNLSSIAVGMSRQDVVGRLGEPHEISKQGHTEYLTYNFDHPFDGRTEIVSSYFVRLIDGKVEAFGEKGDFDSTKGPAITVNMKDAIADQPCDLYSELRKLEALKNDGVLSEGEFQVQKNKALERCK